MCGLFYDECNFLSLGSRTREPRSNRHQNGPDPARPPYPAKSPHLQTGRPLPVIAGPSCACYRPLQLPLPECPNLTRFCHTSHTPLLASTMGKRRRYDTEVSQPMTVVQPVTPAQPTTFSPPIAMQKSVWNSIVDGNFVDAKIFAFSRRAREPGRVDTPKALFINTHVLANTCGYFRSRAPSHFFGGLPLIIPQCSISLTPLRPA